MKAKEFHSLETLIATAVQVGHNKQEASANCKKLRVYEKSTPDCISKESCTYSVCNLLIITT